MKELIGKIFCTAYLQSVLIAKIVEKMKINHSIIFTLCLSKIYTSGSGETSCLHASKPGTFLYSKSPSALNISIDFFF